MLALARVDELMPIDSSGPRNVAATRANLALVNALVGDYPRSLELTRQSIEALDRAAVADDDSFRLAREHSYAQVLLASGRRAEARDRLDRALAMTGKVRARGPKRANCWRWRCPSCGSPCYRRRRI